MVFSIFRNNWIVSNYSETSRFTPLTLNHLPFSEVYEIHQDIQRHMVARYTSICNLIYAHKKSAAFPALIFTNSTHNQQHYLQIP